MADLSQMSVEELQQIANQAPDSSGQDLSKMSTEDLQKIAGITPKPMEQPPQDQTGVGPGTAVISGLSNAGANLIEGTVDAGAWLMEKIGAIKPEFAEAMKANVKKDMDQLFRSGEETLPDDVFEKSREQYPALSAIPQAVTEVGSMMKMNPTAIKVAKSAPTSIKLGTALFNQLTSAGSNALIGAGTAGPNTQDQDFAAMTGAFGSLAINSIGSLIKQAAKSGLLNSTLKNAVEKINKPLFADGDLTLNDKAAQSITNLATSVKTIEDSNYSKIKQLPGTIPIVPVTRSAAEILKENGSTFSPKKGWNHSNSILDNKQQGVLIGAIKSAQQMTTMEQAILLKQDLSASSKLFTKGNAPANVYDAYKALQKQIDGFIATKAESAGLSGDWQLANRFHREIVVPMQDAGSFDVANALKNKEANPTEYAAAIKGLLPKPNSTTPQEVRALLSTMDSAGSKILEQHFIKSTLDDLVDNPENFNASQALMKLNKITNKYSKVLSRDSVLALKGIARIMKESGVVPAGAGKGASGADSTYLAHYAGGTVGASIGAMMGGPIGAGVGSIIGIAVGPKVINSLSKVLDSPAGLSILKGVGQGKPWAKDVGNLIRLAPSAGIGAMINEEQK